MQATIKAEEASIEQVDTVASLVKALLIELEPEAENELRQMDITQIAADLFQKGKLFAILAKDGQKPVGVLTLHECAAIYAGGLFGEISELYVLPDYRSKQVGQLLLDAAVEKAKQLGWKRLEVGSPPPEQWPRTVQFYENNQFEATGTRLRRIVKSN
ncbi:MAG: GNAT family N-acetyltransferase [Chloroflexota bacterium]